MRKAIKSIIVGVIAGLITMAFFKMLNSFLISPISEYYQGAWYGFVVCTAVNLYIRIKESE